MGSAFKEYLLMSQSWVDNEETFLESAPHIFVLCYKLTPITWVILQSFVSFDHMLQLSGKSIRNIATLLMMPKRTGERYYKVQTTAHLMPGTDKQGALKF